MCDMPPLLGTHLGNSVSYLPKVCGSTWFSASKTDRHDMTLDVESGLNPQNNSCLQPLHTETFSFFSKTDRRDITLYCVICVESGINLIIFL